MCNNQFYQPYPQTVSHSAALSAAPQPVAGRALSADYSDVHPGNPQSVPYVQLDPNGVPMTVTPTPSDPVSVQPAGPGTPFVDSTYPTANTTDNGITTLPAPLPPSGNMPESLTNYAYVPGFLRAHVGDLVRVEFLLTDHTTDRVGILSEVGASYIVLESLDLSSRLMCDLFSIRFVTIMQGSGSDVASVQTTYATNRFQG